MQTSPIVVACAADARYALPLAVMLHSAGKATGGRIHAYVLDDGMTGEDKRKVAASVPENVSIEWRRPVSPLDGLPIWGRMPVTTYQKLTLDEWLPNEVRRAVWLDCDLLVLGDIAHLWEPAEPRVLHAVQDQRIPTVSSPFGVAAWRELGLAAGCKYFNAGVLTVDMNAWRRMNVRQRSLDYIRDHSGKVYFWDQEALNAVFAGQWGGLKGSWNWHPSLDHLVGNGAGTTRAEEDAVTPQILHFSGNLKPWTFAGGGHWHALYRTYLDRTAWAGWRPAPRWQDEILAWYETSRARRWVYPAEQVATAVVRSLTRKLSDGKPEEVERA